MGKVLIIKNNSMKSEIYKYAKESYDKKESRYYFTKVNQANKAHLKEIEENFETGGVVLLVNYIEEKKDPIEEIFIGDGVEIESKNDGVYQINYSMKINLKKEQHDRTIKSIIEKIDLDIKEDFAQYCYVIMSDMESLFQELRERLIAGENISLSKWNEKMKKEAKDYQLSALAQNDTLAVRIYPSNEVDSSRTEFQRDRERVVNCRAFRRMVDKAQIFSAEKGDYYRTRMTHSLEVNQIAKAISYALNLNLDLTEAIALGHDLGHTPFGHQGERTLDNILSGKEKVGIEIDDVLLKKRCFGGFKHNYQSARILAQLEEKYIEHPGLNVSVQVIEGVLKHTKLKPAEIALEDFLCKGYLEKIIIDKESETQVCSSLEGQVVFIADEIAQRGHDVDDALTSGVMSIDEFIDRLKISKCINLQKEIQAEREKIEKSKRLIGNKEELLIARIVSCIIHYFIVTTIECSKQKMEERIKTKKDNEDRNEATLNTPEKMIDFTTEAEKVNSYLERVVKKKVICNSEVARADYNANVIVRKLFEKYYSNPRLLHAGTIHKIFVEMLMHENELVSNSAIHLNDGSTELVDKEIEEITRQPVEPDVIAKYMEDKNSVEIDENIKIFEKRKILIRAIVDYIAGMTDGYALEEYEKLK